MLHSQNARKSLTLALEEVQPSSRAKSQEPRAKSQEPRAKSQEPRAKSQEPRAKSQEPRAKSQEPRAKSQEPRAKSQEPRAKSQGAAMSAPRASRGASSQSDSQPSAAPAGARLSDTPHPQGLSRSTARSTAAGALLALVALLAVPIPAQAQPKIWSATLTPGSHPGVGFTGCTNAFVSIAPTLDCSSSSVLSDDDFTLDGTPYTFNQIIVVFNGTLTIGLSPALTVSAAELTLMVDGTAFAFEDADAVGDAFTWANSGLSWTAGQSVSLSLTHPPPPTVVPNYWGLIPSGLGPGDEFRLLFVSSTKRNAVPTSIGTYNTWIQNLAANGHGDIQGYSSTFRVVGSTRPVDARDNTETTGTGVPIYWLNGDQVADNYPDFYDGSWGQEASMRTESGSTVAAVLVTGVWTGSAHDGTEGTGGGFSNALGSNRGVTVGRPNGSNFGDGPLSSTTSPNRNGSSNLYGLSGVFRVNQPLPPEGDLGATSVFAKRYSAGNVKITWNDITIDGAPLPPGLPDYAVTVSGGRRNTTWALSHLETLFGDPLGRGNRYTVEHPTSTSSNNNQSDDDVAFTYTLKVIGDGWLASGKTFLRIDCPPIGSANAVNCGLSTAPSALRALNASAYESYGPMQFRVEVDPPSSGTVMVDYATADRTSGTKRALAGQDYYATSGTLTFAPGETAKFVVVGIIDDAVYDDAETFYLNFSNATGATLSDGQATGKINNTEPLTASFEGVPEAHDGQSAFSFRVAFSEDIGISYQTLRDESFTTTGGAVTGARRVDGRNDLWEITVEPSGAENVTITLPRGRDCGTTGAVCTREDEHTPRALTNSPSATVKGPSASGGGPPSAALTASFSGVPGEHTGESFTFGLTFSENVAGLSYKTLRDSAFSVTNGQITRARRKTKGSSQSWTITVKPDSSAAVTIRLPATTDCEADDAICTSDDRRLSNSPSATVNGPGGTLSFAHFANGDGVTSEVVIVNVAPQPIRPRLYFYDPEGNLMDPQSLLDMLGDLEITEDGAVRVRTEIEPLGELAIATHGRGPLRSGSVKVGSGGSVGGMLRFDLPGIGETVVGPGQPTSDAIFGVRRREGGINTWAAIHNLESSPGLVRCEMLRQGVLLDAVVLPLAANGQTSWTIDEAFQAADTSDLVGSVRCTALGEGQFTAMAVELDAGNGIFTTLPLVPVSPGGETTLEFAHLPNGDGLTSEVVLVNVASHAIRPTLYFFDPQGEPIAAESLLEVGGDLAIQADGGLTVWREMEPLGELAISTHGRGPLRSGSVKVMSDGPIGGFLRFHLPGVGVAGVGASQPMRDAIFPVRRREGGVHTGVVLRNLSETELALTGRLMKKGAVLEEVEILLEGGQEAWYIEEGFTGTDMSDFEGSVRFTAVGEGQFTGMAVELDAGNRIFTTLPVMPVTERMSQE